MKTTRRNLFKRIATITAGTAISYFGVDFMQNTVNLSKMQEVTTKLKLPPYEPLDPNKIAEYDEAYWYLVFYDLWDKNKLRFKREISEFEFEKLQEYGRKYLETNSGHRTQEQKNIVWFYNSIKLPEIKKKLTPILKKLIEDLKTGELLFVKNLNNPQDSLVGRDLLFYKENENFARVLYALCSRYDVHPQLIFTIAIVENNFGNRTVSHNKARGPLQVREDLIEDVETAYQSKLNSPFVPYSRLTSEGDRYWREMQCGVLGVKLTSERLQLRTTNYNSKKISLEDFAWVMLCYHYGIGIVLELEKGNFPQPTKDYLRKTLSTTTFAYHYTADKSDKSIV